MTNSTPKPYSRSFLKVIRYFAEGEEKRTTKEISADIGISDEMVRLVLRDWPEYFTETNTRPNRYSLNEANPDARTVAKEYRMGVVAKKNAQKKWYFLKENEYHMALDLNAAMFSQALGKKWAREGIDNSRKEEIKDAVHKLEALIYVLMEKDYKDGTAS